MVSLVYEVKIPIKINPDTRIKKNHTLKLLKSIIIIGKAVLVSLLCLDYLKERFQLHSPSLMSRCRAQFFIFL